MFFEADYFPASMFRHAIDPTTSPSFFYHRSTKVVHTVRHLGNQYGSCFLLAGLLTVNYRDCVLGGSLSFRLYAHAPAPSSEPACRGSVTSVSGCPPWIYLQRLCVACSRSVGRWGHLFTSLAAHRVSASCCSTARRQATVVAKT